MNSCKYYNTRTSLSDRSQRGYADKIPMKKNSNVTLLNDNETVLFEITIWD